MLIKNNSVKFHPDPIWNDDGALDFFEESRPNNNNNNNNNNINNNNNNNKKMNSYMASVPALRKKVRWL